jgi:uncharacterized protein DUF5677
MRIRNKLLLAGVGFGIGLVFFAFWLRRKKDVRGLMTFEFGDTVEANAFFDRYPNFFKAFECLMNVANKTLGRESTATNRAEDICFSLAQCRDDYLEILFLAASGYGTGASKLVRGLYERAVALTYIAKYPEKAERFVNFAAVQEHKAMKAALEVVTEDEFDGVVGKTATVAQIREAYESVKDQFQMTDCSKCKTKRPAISWDIDVTAMVKKVGPPLSKYFMGSYTIPTLHIHATLASALKHEPLAVRRQQDILEGEFALVNATLIILFVIRQQNDMFKLNLDDDILMCDGLFGDVWTFPNANDTKSGASSTG